MPDKKSLTKIHFLFLSQAFLVKHFLSGLKLFCQVKFLLKCWFLFLQNKIKILCKIFVFKILKNKNLSL